MKLNDINKAKELFLNIEYIEAYLKDAEATGGHDNLYVLYMNLAPNRFSYKQMEDLFLSLDSEIKEKVHQFILSEKRQIESEIKKL